MVVLKICMAGGKQTVFLQREASIDLAMREVLACTNLSVSKSALFAVARARGGLAAGCMIVGWIGSQGAPNVGESWAL